MLETNPEKPCPCNGTGAIDHGNSLEICGCPAPKDFALSPLDKWLEKPGRVAIVKHSGPLRVIELREDWVLVTAGAGASIAEASAHAMNNAMALEWADKTEVMVAP
jgi:hypothetical protein